MNRYERHLLGLMVLIVVSLSIGSWRYAGILSRRSQEIEAYRIRVETLEIMVEANQKRLSGRSGFMKEVAKFVETRTVNRFTSVEAKEWIDALKALNPELDVPDIRSSSKPLRITIPD